MGKASRRKKSEGGRRKVAPAPYVARPFEGLPGETDWVAAHEIIPAATAPLALRSDAVPEGAPTTATLATVLPMAWAALHRGDGTVLVATQSGSSSGDASRDLAAALLAALAAEPGTPVPSVPMATEDTPRLQDILDTAAPLDLTVHEGFDFWVEEGELDGEARASLDRANESVVPTVAVEGVDSAYWARMGERTYIRWVLGDDEDAATRALARLAAAGETELGEGNKLLGAFRAGGLLVPVWEVPADSEPGDHAAALTAMAQRYAAALASDEPLTAEERRQRSGLLSRQVTLR
ncbi:DUF5926 family protein [Marihabitans asiaticum]|uniref:DUF5926 domain-containing protein n=1 Tax=Marihabitans asiaticum TaxID=415218 RepID=A0A560WHA6_9MICO|nr:DUF5926 family protein [Marihabitans asiaticum]TWD16865.1 hypothetical protein FB557_0411 [Marihabitans asiaticum]